MYRVGQNRIYTLYMTVFLVIFLPKILYILRIYMVLANPIYVRCTYGILGRNSIKYTIIKGVCIRFWPTLVTYSTFVGLARTIYIRLIYDIFGRKITKYTVIYGVYIRFWPTLHI